MAKKTTKTTVKHTKKGTVTKTVTKKSKKGLIIGISIGVAVAVAAGVTIPLVLMNMNKGGSSDVKFSIDEKSSVTLKEDNKTAVMHLNWEPSDHSIECSNFTFTLNDSEVGSKIKPESGDDRPLELTITFDEPLTENGSGELKFEYNDKTAKKEGKKGSVKDIKVKLYTPEPEGKATFSLASKEYGTFEGSSDKYDISSFIGKTIDEKIPFFPADKYKDSKFTIDLGAYENSFNATYKNDGGKCSIHLASEEGVTIKDKDEIVATLTPDEPVTGITLTLDAGSEGYFGIEGITQYPIKGIEAGTTLGEVLASDPNYAEPTSNKGPITPAGEDTPIPYALDYYSLKGNEVRDDYVITDNVTLTAEFDLKCLHFEVPKDSNNGAKFYLTQTTYDSKYTKPNVEYAFQNSVEGSWVDCPIGSDNAITIPIGGKIYVKGDNPDGLSYANVETDEGTTTFNFVSAVDGGDDATVNAYGNVMSLLDDGESNTTIIPHENSLSGCFRELFKDCKILERGPETPATVLSEYCYHNMFNNCSKLKYVSNLPADQLEAGCYCNMFQTCTSLEVAPKIDAKTAADGAFSSCHLMFYSCPIKVAPELYITDEEIAESTPSDMYKQMFQNCLKLEKLKVHFGTKDSTAWPSNGNTEFWLGSNAGSQAENTPVFEWLGAESGPETRGAGTVPEGWEIHTYEE